MINSKTSCIKCVDGINRCIYCCGKLVKNGISKAKKQRYKCKSCSKTIVDNYTYNAYFSHINKQIVLLLTEGMGIRSIARILQISATTLLKRIITISNTVSLPVIKPECSYEIDELCTFVKCKSKHIWIVYAFERESKNIIGFNVGARSNLTLKKVVDKVLNTNPECPDMTLEDCNLGENHENPEEQWLECMTECLNNSDNPGYGTVCLEHFLETGEWYEDCMYWTIECDCDKTLTVTPPEEPVIECMRNCGVEGVEGCIERYDADGTWRKECNDLITECECENVEGPEEPGPGEPPIDTEMMNCARDCENSSAYACWEYFHVTGEWMEGCEDIMRDCGCYDPDNEQDCYLKALSYIKNELVLEPESNACLVLEYVKTHFKCIAAITPEDDPEDHDDTDDEWVDGGGNTTSPGTDGPYDETKRKPIWWYHTDHLGSSTYLTDNFGRPSHYYETLPFGEMIVEHNQSAANGIGYDNKFKFNGKELDDATGMYYYGARY